MDYFKEKKNALEYIKMVEGYDGRDLIEILKKHLPSGSSVLELGMGPGTDLEMLSETYKVTGSDYSKAIIDIYRKKGKITDLLVLDAKTLETDRKFDCIYSNKVLIHLTREDMKTSLARQKELLNPGGILLHSFWKGEREEEKQGILFVYYTEDQLVEMTKEDYELLEIGTIKDLEDDDSIYIVLKKK